MGWCAFELEKYSDARDYGACSLQAAEEADDSSWQLHASVLLAQSEGISEKQMSHITGKPVFGVCDQIRLKPACPATETR